MNSTLMRDFAGSGRAILLALLLAKPGAAFAQWTTYGYWRDPISGNWHDSGYWQWGTIPNQIGAQAELNGHLTGFRTINLSNGVWMGGLFVVNGNQTNYSYTINQNGHNIYLAFSDPNWLPVINTKAVVIFNGLVAFGRGFKKPASAACTSAATKPTHSITTAPIPLW